MELDRVIATAQRLEREIQALLDAEAPAATPSPVACRAEETVRSVLAQAAFDPRAVAAPARSSDLLLGEAARVELRDPELAAHLLMEAAIRAGTGDDVEAGAAIARRAKRVAERAGGDVEALAVLSLDVLATLSAHNGGRPTELSRLLENVALTTTASAETLHRLAVLCLWNEDYAAARALLERLVEIAHAGPRSLLPLALDTLAAVDLRVGRWPAAEGRSAEALRLALELGQDWLAASCHTTLATIAAVTGREDECRRRAREALLFAPGSELVLAWAVGSVALLELSLDQPGAAVAELEKVPDAHRLGTSVAPLLPLRIEAYVRDGRAVDAASALENLEVHAASSRHVGTLALSARCRGIVADARSYRLHFEEALELHTRLPTPFERARTQLLFGERLRRGRHRAEAQPVLRSALATFERVGAVRWADRARRELAAMRLRGSDDDVLALLTARELEVASLVARGLTNREVAAALFVSEKTIEYHLRNVYAKLAVRSRTELVRVVLSS